jgi:hypothetical protein
MEHLASNLIRGLKVGQKALASKYCHAGGFALFHPNEPWYAETAPEMLRLLRETKGLLEEGLGIACRRELTCLVTDPEWALETLGVAGLALENLIVVACRKRCLSEFAGTAAHELAHVFSRSVGAYETPFKGEGFACYAAEIMDADTRPSGLPLHYHLVWMLSVGLRPSLPELWRRSDYTSELYDLGWSFTTFVVERFGLERYYRLYRASSESPEARIVESLGMSATKLERDWYAAARESVEVDAATIGRLRRGEGQMCSRAAWLGSH